MKKITYKLGNDGSIEWMHKGLKINAILESGDCDSIAAYRDDEIVYITSKNARYGYCGITAYGAETGEVIDSCFIQNAFEEFQDNWFDWSWSKLTKTLSERLSINAW